MRGAAAALAFGLLVAACGPERPPPASDDRPSKGGAGGGFNFDAGGPKLPGCDGECNCVELPLFVDPPNMYFVLDRSGSMENRWATVRTVVAQIMRSIGPRANFGVTIFPGRTASDACTPGSEVLSVRQGDPITGTDGPTTSAMLAATNVAPEGGTPTSATLQQMLGRVQKLQGKTFILLATDGAPNCNASASCNFDNCSLNIEGAPGCPPGGPNCCEPPTGFRENCLDSGPAMAAISTLKNAGVPVYVIGLPGAAPFASVLDQLAIAGGTAQPLSPRYYAVDAADQSVLLGTLKKVAAKIVATCNFELRDPPADPKLVNVYLDEATLPFDPDNGWSIDGKTVTLLGKACERVKNGDVLEVRIVAGCPRIEPR